MLTAFKACLRKDLKTVLRNWSSLTLIVLGPLVVMMLLILAFSNIGFYNIKIGYVGNVNTEEQKSLMQNINYIGKFNPYDSLSTCINNLKSQQIHLCLEYSNKILNIYYDNTREIISLILLGQIRQAISIEKDIVIKDNIVNIKDKAKSFEDFLGQAESISSEVQKGLINQKIELVKMRSKLLEAQTQVKEQIQNINLLKSTLSSNRNEILNNINNNFNQQQALLNQASFHISQAVSFSTDENSQANLQYVQTQINSLNWQLNTAKNNINTNFEQTYLISNEKIDQVSNLLVTSDTMLQESISKIDTQISQINQFSIQIKDLQSEMSKRKKDINTISNTDVDSLVQPINFNFVPLFTGSERLKNIQLNISSLTTAEKQRIVNLGSLQIFIPIIIVLLVSFVATILAINLSLEEIHSSSFLRNMTTPSSPTLRLCSIFLTVIFITLLQVLIILAVGYLFFYMDIMNNLIIIIGVMVILIMIYSTIGFIIAYLIRSKTTALIFGTTFILFNILFGGVMYPTERMAPFMNTLAQIIPFNSGISILQQSIFYDISIQDLFLPLIFLTLILVCSLIILFIIQKIFLKRFRKGISI